MAEGGILFCQNSLAQNGEPQDSIDSPVEKGEMEKYDMKPSESLTSLQLMLTSIQEERNKDHIEFKLISSDGTYSDTAFFFYINAICKSTFYSVIA